MFGRFATWVSAQMGRGTAFVLALSVVVLWFIAGFWCGFDNTLYQLAINTGTTIVTFLAVFLLQHTANRDMFAIQQKLNEIIRAIDKADNSFIGLENQEDET